MRDISKRRRWRLGEYIREALAIFPESAVTRIVAWNIDKRFVLTLHLRVGSDLPWSTKDWVFCALRGEVGTEFWSVNFSQLEFLKGYGEWKREKNQQNTLCLGGNRSHHSSEPFLSLCKTDKDYSVKMGKCRGSLIVDEVQQERITLCSCKRSSVNCGGIF
jgi:hypothetical protein